MLHLFRLFVLSFVSITLVSTAFSETGNSNHIASGKTVAQYFQPINNAATTESETESTSTPESDAQSDSVEEGDEKSKTNGMTLERMAEIVRTIDENATVRGAAMQLTIADVKVTIITDSKNNRMRAFTVVKSLDGVNQQLLYRMLQANFDSALDARYAIAKAHILSVFIHPMKELEKNQLIEGLGQVVNLVKTYGTAFTSGAMTFGGGDSKNLHRQLIDELLKKGEEI
jgi:hypothetical protein